jgi:hypothetical protein
MMKPQKKINKKLNKKTWVNPSNLWHGSWDWDNYKETNRNKL